MEDAASLNMLVMEMDDILRDHPDDDDGANSVSRNAFIGSVRNGAFVDLLSAPAGLTLPPSPHRQARPPKFSRKGGSVRHSNMRQQSGHGEDEFEIGASDTSQDLKRVRRKHEIQSSRSTRPPSPRYTETVATVYGAATLPDLQDNSETGNAAFPDFCTSTEAPLSPVEQQVEHDRQLLRNTFNAIDRDGGGTIDFEEFEAIIMDESITSGSSSYSKTFVKNLLIELDDDGNGELEFVQRLGPPIRPRL